MANVTNTSEQIVLDMWKLRVIHTYYASHHKTKIVFFLQGGCIFEPCHSDFLPFCNCLTIRYLHSCCSILSYHTTLVNAWLSGTYSYLCCSFSDTEREGITTSQSTSYTYILGGNVIYHNYLIFSKLQTQFYCAIKGNNAKTKPSNYHILNKYPKNAYFIAKFSWE